MPFDASTYEVDPTTLTTPRARLEYLRDFLLRLPAERFDMRNWTSCPGDPIASPATGTLLHDCGTAACIGGWAEGLFRSGPNDRRDAQDLLGLREAAAGELFYAWDGPALSDITRAMAATVLTHLLNTGEVDWSVARKADA